MGKKINIRTLTASAVEGLPTPVIFCTSEDGLVKTLLPSYHVVSLNLPVAKAIVASPPMQSRAGDITNLVKSLLPASGAVFLTDYEVLFNPEYGLDIMRLFVELSRQNRIAVKWAGTLRGDTLVYAEPGFDDYAQYKISSYNITVVS